VSEPPPTPPDPQVQQDGEHLRLLGILYFVSAGLSGIGMLVGLIYVASAAVFMVAPMESSEAQEMRIVGGLFGGIGLLVIVMSAVWVLLDVLAGRYLMAARHRTFCLVVAVINCMSFPLGTALGVFTFIVLTRPTVQARFAEVAGKGAAQGAAKA
jgi:hypothetical protein